MLGVVILLAGCTGDVVTAPDTLQFAFPLEEPERFGPVIGVDHDPEVHSDGPLGDALCTAYDGSPFPACYDEHRGSDYLLDGGFDAMDSDSPDVLAAADGIVVSTEDGQYDRCHATIEGVNCDGHERIANHVIVEHLDGWTTHYWHLKTDSVLVVVGEEVVCGQPLGQVGSSGNSSAPHLHFQVEDVDEQHVDPYAGEFSQDESMWLGQREDDHPRTACP